MGWRLGGWVGGLVGGFDWWVGLGGLTIISDFHATLGSGETMKKNGNLIHVQLTALHIILKWMRFSFFGSFANAVVITSLYFSSLLFSFLLIITTRSCRRVGGWVGGSVGWWVGVVGGFTMISEFCATLGRGETVKKTQIGYMCNSLRCTSF